MNPIIRIPLTVTGLHALAGFFTNGPTVAAMYGLVAHLERETGVPMPGFGFSVKHYDARLDEYLKLAERDGTSVKPLVTGYRLADAELALFAMVPEDFEIESEHLLAIADVVNRSRVQGGMISEIITPSDLKLFVSDTEQDFVTDIVKTDEALNRLYLSTVAPAGLSGDALLDYYADALVDESKVLMCNGYVQVGDLEGARIAEPSFTLAELIPVYKLKEMSTSQADELVKRFFWKFDSELNQAHPDFFVIN